MEDFFYKIMFFFGLFSGDKGGYIDVWMIKITIKHIKLKWLFVYFKSIYLYKL